MAGETMDPDGKIRYAVVGAGSLAQTAVLPAFRNAHNSRLSTIVSGDDEKREELAGRYGLRRTWSYEQFDECMRSGEVDAVYITLPNHLHRLYTERAANAGIHVLCEKPMAPNESDCRRMIDAARTAGVKLMAAYRLHFEQANLEAIKICESGRLGDLRIFHSVFTQQVEEGNVRLTQDVEHGGGPLFDMGVYCINAARYLFRDEPVELSAFRGNIGSRRFQVTEEMDSVILRFPEDRLANFTVSFGAASASRYTVVGTKGVLLADPAYDYSKDLRLRTSIGDDSSETIFPVRDQFGPEILYFSDCILNDREPEPSGEEGLIDVQIIRAAYRASDLGRPVPIEAAHRKRRPEPAQEIDCPALKKPDLVNARMPKKKEE
jgi:glucose-fructose oxidoreductase